MAWPPIGMTVEVMRLLILDENERWLTLLGLQVEDLAAWRYFDLGAPGGTCWVADDGRRLVGFASLVPCDQAVCGAESQTFLVRPLVVSARAPEGTWGALLRYACASRLENGGQLFVPVQTADLRAMDALTEWGFKPAGGIASVVARSGGADTLPNRGDRRFANLRVRYFSGPMGFEPVGDGPTEFRTSDRSVGGAGPLCAVCLGLGRRGFDGAEVLAIEDRVGQLIALVGYRRVSHLYAVSGYSLARVDAIALDLDWTGRGLIRWLAGQLRVHLARRGMDGALIEVGLADGLAPQLLREFGQAGFRVNAMHQLLRFGPAARAADAPRAPAPSTRDPQPVVFEEGIA